MSQSGAESTARSYSRSSTGVGVSASRRSMSSMSNNALSLSNAIQGNIDISKPAIIIELGKAFTKIGFAGDFSPRAIIRTEYIDHHLSTQRDLFDNLDKEDKKYSRIFQFFMQIYYNVLLTMPRERRVVIVESLLCPSHIRRALTIVFLERFCAPSILFIPSHLAATFPFNTTTALVMDLGFQETVVMPVAEGITMLSHWEAVNKGARKLYRKVREMLETDGQIECIDGSRRPLSPADWSLIDKFNMIEDIVVRSLFVTSMDRSASLQSGESPHPVTQEMIMPLGIESLVVSGRIRELAADCLFDSPNEDEPGLHEIVHSIIARVPIDLRHKLFSCILLVGGLAVLKGLRQRLKEEIKCLGEMRGVKMYKEEKETTNEDMMKENKKEEEPNDIGFLMFPNSRMEPWMSWLGGSMFGSLSDTLQHASLSREEWLKEKILPDCTDFIDPFESKKTKIVSREKEEKGLNDSIREVVKASQALKI